MNTNQAATLARGTQPILNDPAANIDMGAVMDEWRLSKSYVEQYTRDFVKLDTIVDAVPLHNDLDVPFVGDTTLPGLVRSIPRDSLEQLPVFSAVVNGTKNSVPALLCTYLLKKFVFNEDTFGKGLLSTLQIGGEQALTHGYAPFMVATGSMYDDFGTTMRLLHYMDTAPEPGITDANESGYHYVVANLTATRVKKILQAAQNNAKTSWSIPALQQVLAASPRAKDYSIYESAPRQNQAGEAASPTYQFITRYETGKGGTIITFCPEVAETPLRVLDSFSKWGYPRVQYLVIDPAALTPFGISRVRLASPNQNLMNIYYGNIASMLLLNSKPPILKRGRFTTPVQLKQGVTWETLDQNATASLVNMDNGALEFFPQMAQQFAGQISNIMGGQNANASGGEKVSNFSKTAPGVKQAQQFIDSGTNQITKIFENFLRQYALVGLDTILSEQVGEDNLIVDDDTKNSLNEVSAGMVGDNNVVKMEWERFYAGITEWSIEISVSVSKDEMDDKKRSDLQDMLVVLAQNAQDIPGAAEKVQEITNLLMADEAPLLKPTVVNPNAAVTPPTPAGAAAAAPKTPAESITFKDAVAAGATDAAAAMLEQAGLPSADISRQKPATGEVVGGKVKPPAPVVAVNPAMPAKATAPKA